MTILAGHEAHYSSIRSVLDRAVRAAEQGVHLLGDALAKCRGEEWVLLDRASATAVQQAMEGVQQDVISLLNYLAAYDDLPAYVGFLDRADSVLEHTLLTLYLGSTEQQSDAHAGRVRSTERQLKSLIKLAHETAFQLTPLPDGVVRLQLRR
jgi:hypothetical protein